MEGMKEYIERASVHSIIERTSTFAFTRGGMHEQVDSLPAADVVEVKHAYWIDHHSGGSFCSACKRWVPYSHHPKYCETCGARMDKEDET